MCVCDGMKENTNAYKSQANTSINSLRLENNQNTVEVNNKTLEIRSLHLVWTRATSEYELRNKFPNQKSRS